MENGWMETGLSGCGAWIESGSEEWRGSGSHTTLEGKFEWTPFRVLYNFD